MFVMSVVALGLENQTARRRSAVAGSKVCAQALDYGVGSALRVTKAEDTGSTITLAENVCTARLHFLRRGVATAQPSFSYTKRSKNLTNQPRSTTVWKNPGDMYYLVTYSTATQT